MTFNIAYHQKNKFKTSVCQYDQGQILMFLFGCIPIQRSNGRKYFNIFIKCLITSNMSYSLWGNKNLDLFVTINHTNATDII